MMKVGITGGIGSGKSTVCRLFARLGVAVYDSDREAKRLMAEDAALRKLYIALRRSEKLEYTLESLAQDVGMTAGMALCGLHIFSELGLVTFSVNPLAYRLIPSGKVSLESSRLRGRMLALRG